MYNPDSQSCTYCISSDRSFPLCLTGADERTELWCIRDHANGHVHESRSLSESREQGPARKYKTSGTRHSSLASQNVPKTKEYWGKKTLPEKKNYNTHMGCLMLCSCSLSNSVKFMFF